MRYRLQTGSFAWVIQRLTGIALTLYIFLHLYELSALRSPEKYAAMLATMRLPFVRLSEAGLLGLVLGHALNGIRVTLLEAGVPTRYQKPIFWTAFALGTLLFIVGSLPIAGVIR